MNIDLSFLKITRFLIFPIAFLFLANTASAAPMAVPPRINFLDFVPSEQQVSFNQYPSQISQDGILPKRKKNKKCNEGGDLQKKENSLNEVHSSESEEGINPVKSYQQLKGILEEVDMMVSGWV